MCVCVCVCISSGFTKKYVTFLNFLGLKRQLQDNYEWGLANFGNFSISDLIDRFTFDIMIITPSNHTVYGVQGRPLRLVRNSPVLI